MKEESVKLMILTSFVTPLLLGVVTFFIRRLFTNLDKKLTGLQENMMKLQLNFTNVNATVGELKGNVNGIERRIDDEVDDRNKRLDRLNGEIIKLGKELAVLQNEVKNLKAAK